MIAIFIILLNLFTKNNVIKIFPFWWAGVIQFETETVLISYLYLVLQTKFTIINY